MPQDELRPSSFSADTRDFLAALHDHGVEYLIVGGEAVIYYGHPRLTGDIDIFYNLTEDNVARLYAALNEFWDGTIPGLESEQELREPGMILQFGIAPNRIDLLNRIDGVEFQAAWPHRQEVRVAEGDADILVCFIGLDDLVRNKRAAGRPKDLDDLRFLEEKR